MSAHFSSLYASAYDLLNEGKPYKDEIDFVQALYARYCGSAENLRSVLDLGCGSGLHLSKIDPNIRKTGIDLSEDMLRLAKGRNIPNSTFETANVGDYRSKTKFDLIYSLFHVMSYQSTDNELSNTLQTVHKNLESGGLAVFDFWHRAAWDQDPPVTRVKTKIGPSLRVKRISVPKVDYLTGLVSIEMNIFIHETGSAENTFIHFVEHHDLRAYTLRELTLASTLCGLRVVGSGPWMTTERQLTAKDWYGWIALQAASPA
jgi:SAM-dependent methyltransferase